MVSKTLWIGAAQPDGRCKTAGTSRRVPQQCFHDIRKETNAVCKHDECGGLFGPLDCGQDFFRAVGAADRKNADVETLCPQSNDLAQDECVISGRIAADQIRNPQVIGQALILAPRQLRIITISEAH
jgi:hypothetical protein